jgi:WD40 repeat protein
MELSGKQLERLQDALIDAFPSQSLLEQMLWFKLEKKLNAIAGGSNLPDIVFKLIETASSQGWMESLIYAAHEKNKGNLKLKAFIEELVSHNLLKPNKDASTKNNCKATALAQQLRGWFEMLGYKFEKNYEAWNDTYFEWIINIPVRRNRYDRILVRGIAGEAGLGDVIALRQSVDTQRTDEGWLVTARRISRAARDEASKKDNQHLGCYTFDELLAQDADFSGYLDWLEAEVKRRKIDTKYVLLACNKEEIDPVTKRQIAVSRYDKQDGWIDGYIDRWLDDPAKEHISILGEFGTGKTWFALHYAWVTLQRYRDAQKRGTELPRLPLVIPLRDYAKAVSVESLFSEFFFRQYKIPLPHYDAFLQLNRMGKLLLIFDGFDEMAAKVDRDEMINNFWELAKVVVPGAKVILTCRTEHFPEAKEGRALLNAELQASIASLTGETPQFEVLELEKFNDEQIQQVLSFQAERATVEMVMGNTQLLDLARRPVMTELILEALPDIEVGKPVDISRIYLYAVRRKMEKDIKQERTFTGLADKLYFLCELSWEMLSTQQMSLNYKFFPDRIRHLFGVIEKDLDHWRYDMMGQTMLIRNTSGDYTPAHRSLLEFFVAYKFAAELGVLASDFTDLARDVSSTHDGVNTINCTWSSYFSRQVNRGGLGLKSFTTESLQKLRETFGKERLTKAVMDLLMPMIDLTLQGQEHISPLVNILEETRWKSEDEVGYVGGNTATLLVKFDREALQGKNLSHAIIKGADFSEASLQHVNFTHVNLTDSVFKQSFGGICSVAISPDGKFLATSDTKHKIHLWQIADGKTILVCKGHSSTVSSVAFSSDGKIIASGSYDNTIKLWDISTGECIITLKAHTDWVRSIAFNPQGSTLVSGSKDNTIKLWDVVTGECLQTFQDHTDGVLSVAFSPDGKTIASGSCDETVKLWDVNKGICLQSFQGHNGWVGSVTFSPDGQMLASCNTRENATLKLWNVNTGENIKTLPGRDYTMFSPDGQIIASCGKGDSINLLNIHTGECISNLQGHTKWVAEFVFSPDGQTVASGSNDETIRLWDVNTGQCTKIFQGYTNRVNSVSFSPDDTILASACEDKTLKLWDMNTAQCLKILQGHTRSVESVIFNPNSKILASIDGETIKFWDIFTRENFKTLQCNQPWTNYIVYSPDGKILAHFSIDKTIILLDACTGVYLRTLKGHKRLINSVSFSPDSKMLASGSGDSTVRLWDIETGECIKTWKAYSDTVSEVCFGHNNQTLITGGGNEWMMKIWDIHTEKLLNTLQGHTAWIGSIVFNQKTRMLASCSDDETIRLWNIETVKCLKILQGHTNTVESIAFTSDGKILASGSSDETIKLWDVKTGDCLNTLKAERPYAGMDITNIKGLSESEKATLKTLGAISSADNV